MQDLLSQDEIDALLHGVDDGDVETDEDTSEDGVRSYDLASQDRIVRGRMPTLEMINERFARYTRISLFNLLHVGPVCLRDAPFQINRMIKYGKCCRNPHG